MPPFMRLLPLPRQLTTDLPKPVAAYVGFLLSLPRLAVDLPGQAVSIGVSLATRYEELAELGASVLGGRPGDADEDIDEPMPSYASLDTSAWGAADTDADVVRLFEADGAETVAEQHTEALAVDTEVEEQAPEDDTTAEQAAADASIDAVSAAPPASEQSPAPALARAESGSGAEFLAAAVTDRAEPPASTPERQDLPVEGYDGLSVTTLRSRLAGLSKADLEMLRDYEAGHAKRVTVLSMLERAISKA